MRRYLPHAITLLLVLSVAELMCYLTIRLSGPTMRFLRKDPNADFDDPKRAETYLSKRHPKLGWVITPSNDTHVDATLARLSPAFPEPGSACASVYGDSFAWGSDASDDDAWANVLAKKLNCRVANYGVPGYGVDQAFMRFEHQTQDEAPSVILSIFPDDLLRSTTHFIWLVVLPELDYRGQKPRYRLEQNGELTLEPMPYHNVEELLAFIDDPLPHLKKTEFLEPTGYYARNRYTSFPYIYSMGKFLSGDLFTSLVSMKLTGRPVLEDYVRPGHPSRAFELNLAIIEKFGRTAQERGKKLFVMMLPDREMFAQYRAKKIWSYQEFIDGAAKHATVINMGEYFLQRIGDRNFREIEHGGGHYTAEGYAMVADRAAEVLQPK